MISSKEKSHPSTMKKSLVLYRSKYGATKKYAHWLAESIAADCMEIKSLQLENLQAYERLIFGGGIYATGIAGISFLTKNEKRLGHLDILIFAVGASPEDPQAFEALRKRNLRGFLEGCPLFLDLCQVFEHILSNFSWLAKCS